MKMDNVQPMKHVLDLLGTGSLSREIIYMAFYTVLVTLPFFVFGHLLMWIARTRLKQSFDPSNPFHRLIDFCEKRLIGHIVLGIMLFLPTIAILVQTVFLYPHEVLDGILVATVPWALLPLAELLDYRRERAESSGPTSITATTEWHMSRNRDS
ncbi:MAG: hypothetical protein ACTSYX_05715 [Candidatus Thorarchaeota archaeon]